MHLWCLPRATHGTRFGMRDARMRERVGVLFRRLCAPPCGRRVLLFGLGLRLKCLRAATLQALGLRRMIAAVYTSSGCALAFLDEVRDANGIEHRPGDDRTPVLGALEREIEPVMEPATAREPLRRSSRGPVRCSREGSYGARFGPGRSGESRRSSTAYAHASSAEPGACNLEKGGWLEAPLELQAAALLRAWVRRRPAWREDNAMTVRTEVRRGTRRYVIDIRYTKTDGTKARFRQDAEVQTQPAARA